MSESPLLSPCGWELSSGGSCLRPMPLGKGSGPWGGGEHPQRRVKEPEKLEVLTRGFCPSVPSGRRQELPAQPPAGAGAARGAAAAFPQGDARTFSAAGARVAGLVPRAGSVAGSCLLPV